jgi:glucan biosynthesis protein C
MQDRVMNRRYDIDWLRVIAIGLLLIYHTSIAFQPWGFMLGFITNDTPWASLWIPMAMLNVWRIPILFFISGMGVYFTIRNRSWKQLLNERARKIGVPFLFGIFLIVPVQLLISQAYYHQGVSYSPGPAHLWFLGNIFVYVLLLFPVFFYLKGNEKGKLVTGIKRILGTPFSLLIAVAAFITETVLVNPMLYELYAMTWHGFFLGLLAFFFGFCFMLGGISFWNMLLKWRWIFVTISVALYIFRLQAQMKVPDIQLATESACWIFSVFAFGHKYLNRPGKALCYLSEAAYPVYIIHMIFLYLSSSIIFPLDVDVQWKYIIVLMLTVTGCLITYEYIIRRVSLIRMVFGLKPAGKPLPPTGADL